ncbi:MAG TPA: FIST N-terminal domain-containing protein [Rhizobacter sp.]|jgi:small ligand-binding sensory domain FIST|nr:FIST N-terminal domain-containing protein [Rhizobacter sp.]
MKLFAHAHATHPDWRIALALAAAQIEAQRSDPAGQHIRQPTLGWAYFSDHYAAHAQALLAELQQRWPGVAWVGSTGVGLAANGVEYFDEPALVLMLGDLPREQFRVFSGAHPLSQASADFVASTAQVHADGRVADLSELIADMSARTATGYLFGGLASARNQPLQLADGVFEGGLSGVAFGPQVALVSRVTQGCQPVGRVRRITECERNVVALLDGEPALECLLADLGVSGREPREALPRIRETLAGLSDGGDDVFSRPGQFGADTRVRHIVGIDPARGGVALGEEIEEGMQLAFCRRDTEAARRDLVRICSEIREEIEPEALSVEAALALQGASAEQAPHPARQIAGAIYVSCLGRGGPHFGAPSAEMAIIRRALGDVPLAGFFASGEIARRHVYGYTGVLTVFPA